MTKHPVNKPDIKLICPVCGDPYFTKPSELKRGYGKYCGRACANTLRSRPAEERFWEKVNKTDTCWLWTGGNTGGKWPYGVLGKGRKLNEHYRAHHFSYELHIGPVPEGVWVLHKCDVTLCVNPEHLFLGKPADNTADMMLKDRCATRKLTQSEVDKIREGYRNGATQRELANQYDTSVSNIFLIVHHITWKH